MSFPEIITMSRAGSMRCLIWRKVSRIFRFALFRATAFPTFFEAMIPNLFLPNSLGREKMMHNLPTRFFFPLSITFSNSGLLASRSIFLKEKFSIHSTPVPLQGMKVTVIYHKCRKFSAIRPSNVFYLFACGLPVRVFHQRWNFVCGSHVRVFF